MIRQIATLLATATMAFAATGDITVAVRSDGFSADITVEGFTTGATYNFGLSGSYNSATASTPYIDVVSKGFTSAGAATTTTRRVYVTSAMRKVYPNQNSKDETGGGDLTIRCSLSEPIYQKDNAGAGNSGTAPTFTAPSGFIVNAGGGSQSSNAASAVTVTNNSTLAYPKAMGHWDWRTVKPFTRKTDTFTVGYRAVSAYGIAGVRLDATGATSAANVNATATTVSKVGPTASGLYYDAYQMTVPLTSFTQGEQIRLRARVYPLVGDTTEDIDTDDDTTIRQDGLGRIEVTCDKTGALISYGVVKTAAAGGNDATGATSTSLPTARTTPYATIAEAINDNASVIYLTDDGTGSHAFTQTPVKSQAYCIEIRPDPEDVASNITMTNAIGSSGVRCKHLMLAGGYNVSISAGSFYFDGDSETYDSTFIADTVNWDTASTSLRADVHDFKMVNWMDVTATNWRLFRSATIPFAFSAMGCVLGSSTDRAIDSFGAFVANSMGSSTYEIAVVDGSASNPLNITRNVFFDYNRLDRYDNNGTEGFKQEGNIDSEFSFRGNLLINVDAGEGDNFFFDNVPMDNAIYAHNTIQGMPFAGPYNTTTSALITNWFFRGNATYRQSVKTDTHSPADGTRIGNWSYVFGAGNRDNRIDGTLGFLPSDAAGPAGFTGLNAGLVGSGSNYAELGYTDDNSGVGDGTGGGDYKPTADSVLRNAMQAANALLAFDLFGTDIPASGTMDIGAVLNAVPAPASTLNATTTNAGTITIQ